MKALLWKDYGVNRHVLLIGLAILVFPYVFGGALIFYEAAQHELTKTSWYDFWSTCSVYSVALSLLTIGLLGGNAIAGERADRSAEFLAYLPPSRRAIITSKALLAIGAGVLIWVVNLLSAYGLAALGGDAMPEDGFRNEGLPILAATAALIFGVAWFASSFLSSPAIAMGLGFLAPAMIGGVVTQVIMPPYESLLGHGAGWWYCTSCVILGTLCFAAGIVYYLRRVEP